ncbi:hypothetical protein K439DRAFT_1620004 [Ramaria rubella]|nr:hypothetical protein K439DRAFT_1620004 [Ramaria rubella]
MLSTIPLTHVTSQSPWWVTIGTLSLFLLPTPIHESSFYALSSHLCKGSTNAANCGRIMQKCCNYSCNYAVYHTEAYGTFQDAEVVATHLNNYAPFTPPALPPPLPPPPPPPYPAPPHPHPYPHPYPPPPPAQDPSIPNALPAANAGVPPASNTTPCCGPLCQKKKPTKSLKKCLFQRCAKCCGEEFRLARLNGVFRRECAPHMYRPAQQDGPFNPPAPAPLGMNIATAPSDPAAVLLASDPSAPPNTAPGTPFNQVRSSRLYATSISNTWSKEATDAQNRAHEKRAEKASTRLLKVAGRKDVSITIWLPESQDPVHYRYNVVTFPSFTLGVVTKLVQDLPITSDDYLQTWNNENGHWESHMLNTIHTVKIDERLLYKLTRKLLARIPDSECIGLDKELEMQHSNGKRKRTSTHESPMTTSCALADKPSPTSSVISLPSTSSSSLNISSSSASLNSHFKLAANDESTASGSKAALHHRNTSPPPKKCPRPFPMLVDVHEPTNKKCVWPTDFHVSMIDEGFTYIERGMQQRKSSSKLFLEFFGQKIVPMTFKNNRGWYNRKADENLKAIYIDYGETKEGLWPAFMKACREKRAGNTYEQASDEDEDSMSTSSLEPLDLNNAIPPLNPTTASSKLNSSDQSTSSSKHLNTCQFCKNTLPMEPSPALERLLTILLSPSFSCPAPTLENAHARRHRGPEGFKILMEFCGGHNHQDKVLAMAQGCGWPIPDNIDANILTSCVASLGNELTSVVLTPNTNLLFRDLLEHFRNHRARQTRSLNGLSSHMEYKRWGYYGDVGALIIHRQLLRMFPDHTSSSFLQLLHDDPSLVSVDSDIIAPLTYSEFLMSVLVPYTSILLIQADQPGANTTFEDAYRVWMDSGDFGSLYSSEPTPSSPPSPNTLTPAVIAHTNTASSPPVKEEDEDIIIITNSPPPHTALLAEWITNVAIDENGDKIEVLVLEGDEDDIGWFYFYFEILLIYMLNFLIDALLLHPHYSMLTY